VGERHTIYSCYHARTGSDKVNGFGSLTDNLTSPLRTVVDYGSALIDFHTVSQATGPSWQVRITGIRSHVSMKKALL